MGRFNRHLLSSRVILEQKTVMGDGVHFLKLRRNKWKLEKIFHVFKHLPKIMQPTVEGPKDNYHKENVYNKSKKFLYINFFFLYQHVLPFITELSFMVWVITPKFIFNSLFNSFTNVNICIIKFICLSIQFGGH